MKVIIIDDEPLARSIIREYLSTYAEAEIVAECNDGFEGLKAIAEHQPQLIFLDIQMPKLTGFEMLELVDHPPQVIFATAFEEYAIKAFETHAIDYLLKPFSKERFDKAWQKALQHPGPQAPQALLAATSNVAGHQTRVVVKDCLLYSSEQLGLISATDSLHASFRAQQVGENEQDHFFNQQMLPVQWKFIEVCELHVLSELSDGAELYSRIAEADDAVNHIRELRTRASDLLNRALQETIETN